MIPRSHAIRVLILAAGFGAVAGCSTSATRPGPAATGMPIANLPSGSYTQGTATNLAPDPDTLRTWLPGSFALRKGGPGGAVDLEMLGKGPPAGSIDLYSPEITVSPGKTYVFSLWIDPSHTRNGYGVLGIYAPSRMIAYGQVRIIPGPAGRYSVSATIPKDQNVVRIDFQPNGTTIVKGQKLKVSQPMLLEAPPQKSLRKH